jgi:hypothetical protein
MSIPFLLITYQQAEAAYAGRTVRGRPPETAAFTIRIKNKGQIRDALQRTFGLSSRSLFPDVPGLAQFGRAWR